MTLRLATDPETGVRTLTIETKGDKPERALRAETRERNRQHIAGMEDARIRGEALRAQFSAEDEHAALIRAGNPAPAEPAPSEVPSRRAALASLLLALDAAKSAELALSGQVADAISHHQEAKARLAVASTAVHDTKATAARATANWLAGDRTGERPDNSAVADASAAVARAAADVEAADGAVAVLQSDLAAAELATKHALKSAQDADHAVATAYAVDLANQYAALEAVMTNLRWQLLGYRRSTQENAKIPSVLHDTFRHHAFQTDAHRYNSPVNEAYGKQWLDWRKSLLTDANAELFPE